MSKDLVVLTADIQQEKTIEVLLRNRCHSLGIRPISFDIFRHPHRDAGVYFKAADFLALYLPLRITHMHWLCWIVNGMGLPVVRIQFAKIFFIRCGRPAGQWLLVRLSYWIRNWRRGFGPIPPWCRMFFA